MSKALSKARALEAVPRPQLYTVSARTEGASGTSTLAFKTVQQEGVPGKELHPHGSIFLSRGLKAPPVKEGPRRVTGHQQAGKGDCLPL